MSTFSLRSIRLSSLLTAVAVLASISMPSKTADAALVEVSVKFILDANENRSERAADLLNTNADVYQQKLWANFALCASR